MRLEKRLADTRDTLSTSQRRFAEQIEHEKKTLKMQMEDVERKKESHRRGWAEKLAALAKDVQGMVAAMDQAENELKNEADWRGQWNQRWNEFQMRVEKMENDVSAQLADYNRASSNDSLFLRAVEAHTAGRFAEALGYLSNCLTLNPGHVPAWRYRVLCYEAAGLMPEARAAAQMVLKLSPDDRMMKEWLAKQTAPQ